MGLSAHKKATHPKTESSSGEHLEFTEQELVLVEKHLKEGYQ